MQVIAEHFYQQGNFSVGDTFVREAGIPDEHALKQPYIAMHAVLKEVKGQAILLPVKIVL
jgi:hypothetical protein